MPEPSESPRLPLDAWRRDLELSETQWQRLERLDEDLQVEWRERGTPERRRELRGWLEAQLASFLTADQLARIDLAGLFAARAPSIVLSFEESLRATLAAPFDDGPGDVSTIGLGVGGELRLALAPSVALTIDVRADQTEFHFSDAVELALDGEPFETLYSGRVSLGLTWQLTERWSAVVNGSISTGVEDGVDPEDGFVYGGFGAATYAFTERFALGFGVLFRTRLEDDPRVIPLPIVRLRVDFREDLWLTLGVPQGLRLTYRPVEGLEVSLTGGLSGALNAQDSRLDDRGFAPRGVFRQTTVPVAVVLEWRPLATFRIELEGGAIV